VIPLEPYHRFAFTLGHYGEDDSRTREAATMFLDDVRARFREFLREHGHRPARKSPREGVARYRWPLVTRDEVEPAVIAALDRYLARAPRRYGTAAPWKVTRLSKPTSYYRARVEAPEGGWLLLMWSERDRCWKCTGGSLRWIRRGDEASETGEGRR
jgi:hypothetical protein